MRRNGKNKVNVQAERKVNTGGAAAASFAWREVAKCGTRDAMWQHWIIREPALAFGLPVYVLAAIAGPLLLGWTGTTWIGLAVYLVIVSGAFSVADSLARPACYPNWASVIPQSLLSLVVLALPAALAFGIGSIGGAAEEALDEEVCASRRQAEADTAQADADDAFDVTPDCVIES